MSAVLPLIPRSRDEVERRAAWIAARHEEALAEANHTHERVDGDRCAADRLGEVRADGVLFVGHGLEGELRGSDERPLFGGDRATSLRDRWMHAIACEAGVDLGARLVREGATLFVGYDRRLDPRWIPEDLDPELAALLPRLVTHLTVALADGRREVPAARRELAELRDRILGWLDDRGASEPGLRAFCTTLVNNLRWRAAPL